MQGLAAEVESRVLRGLELWRSRRMEIEALADGAWSIPSASWAGRTHRVSPEGTCNCKDAAYHPGLRCKHAWCLEFEVTFQAALAERLRGAGVDGATEVPGRRSQ